MLSASSLIPSWFCFPLFQSPSAHPCPKNISSVKKCNAERRQNSEWKHNSKVRDVIISSSCLFRECLSRGRLRGTSERKRLHFQCDDVVQLILRWCSSSPLFMNCSFLDSKPMMILLRNEFPCLSVSPSTLLPRWNDRLDQNEEDQSLRRKKLRTDILTSLQRRMERERNELGSLNPMSLTLSLSSVLRSLRTVSTLTLLSLSNISSPYSFCSLIHLHECSSRRKRKTVTRYRLPSWKKRRDRFCVLFLVYPFLSSSICLFHSSLPNKFAVLQENFSSRLSLSSPFHSWYTQENTLCNFLFLQTVSALLFHTSSSSLHRFACSLHRFLYFRPFFTSGALFLTYYFTTQKIPPAL